MHKIKANNFLTIRGNLNSRVRKKREWLIYCPHVIFINAAALSWNKGFCFKVLYSLRKSV